MARTEPVPGSVAPAGKSSLPAGLRLRPGAATGSIGPMLYERIFPRWRPDPATRPTASSSAGAALSLEWLGTAGWIVRSARTTVLLDPFVTRPSLARTALSPLVPDAGAIERWIPPRVDAVLCGHSHYDHLLDAPAIARARGALLIGSASTCAFGRAAGIAEEKLREVPPDGLRLDVGDLSLRFVPSKHGRLGRVWLPFPGEVRATPPLPRRLWHYRMGGAYGIVVRAPGATLYHNGSADLVDAELAGERADVLVVGLAGRKATRDYFARLCGALAPSLVVPTHHDAFFAPLERGLRLLPGIDLEGFASEIRSRAPGATIALPGYAETLAVPAGDARGAAFVAASASGATAAR